MGIVEQLAAVAGGLDHLPERLAAALSGTAQGAAGGIPSAAARTHPVPGHGAPHGSSPAAARTRHGPEQATALSTPGLRMQAGLSAPMTLPMMASPATAAVGHAISPPGGTGASRLQGMVATQPAASAGHRGGGDSWQTVAGLLREILVAVRTIAGAAHGSAAHGTTASSSMFGRWPQQLPRRLIADEDGPGPAIRYGTRPTRG